MLSIAAVIFYTRVAFSKDENDLDVELGDDIRQIWFGITIPISSHTGDTHDHHIERIVPHH
jgi:hypothetical protein